MYRPFSRVALCAAVAFTFLTVSAEAALTVLDFEDVVIVPGNTVYPGQAGPEYSANGYTLNNTGSVFGPSAIYFVDEGLGYPSTAVYPQYNETFEIRRADGGTFDFVSVDVASDPRNTANTGTLVGLDALGGIVGTVPFSYSAARSPYTTVFGNFNGVAAVRISYAGNIDASRGAIDNFTIVPEPGAGAAALALAAAVMRRRRRLALTPQD